MNRFMEWFKNNKVPVLLTLLLILIVPMTVTLGKYVKDQSVGEFSLEVKAEPAILVPGSEFRTKIPSGTTDIVFGYTKDYADAIGTATGYSISTTQNLAKYYRVGTTMYVLSDRQIYANPDCENMFYQLTSSVKQISFDNFDTKLVTTMCRMFNACKSFTSLDVSNFNTANVTNMRSMFYDCSSLTTVDLTGWNTANVTDMGGMFNGCSALTDVGDLTGWNTGSVTIMSSMFFNCSSLTAVDLTGWNTANVTAMGSLFYNCSKLKIINGLTSWDTGSVTNMNKMFSSCSSLTTVDLTGWNTGNVTDMNGMFALSRGLTALDLSGFNTSNVTNMGTMFSNCSNLSVIYGGSGWSTDNVTTSSNMFYNCTKLYGGQGTKYSSSYTNITYARIDDPANGNPGYFTAKP